MIKNLTTLQIARGHAYTLSIAGEYQCSVEATVRGLLYHINQSVREAAFGEQLNCTREGGNRSEDTFAVAVVEAIRLHSFIHQTNCVWIMLFA